MRTGCEGAWHTAPSVSLIRWLLRLTLLALCLLAAWGTPAPGPKVCLARLQGTIGPASASYLARAIGEAAGQNAQCLIIELDTPGGLLDSTKEIIQSFLRSPVPTVVYVAPQGAWAGSAGCFITLAADVAAMAPSTSIGAAHPVSLGGGGEKLDETMKQKLENFASSYIEAIAAKRHRNLEWARASVRDSAAITADKALELNVVDLIAENREDLLRKLDGREVGGRKLATAGATVTVIPMTTREQVFQVIAHPQVMLILMLIVMYGVIGEMTSPGAILPGVAGVISLLVLLYLASVLPMNVTGLALIGVAIALFIFDAFAPTHGVLTTGGIVAFFLGTLMLFDRTDPFLRLSLLWVLPATVVTALFFIFVAGAGIRAQRLPSVAGADTLLGRQVPALEAIDASGGRVFLEGEYWKAVSASPIQAGQLVLIVAREGLTLKVQPCPDSEEKTP
ncbi:MAG: nodulation protein NfeD [Holophagaceae bacterium]|nr:nodulation protein NfeD [Holophagaceae bacterium]